MAVLICSTSIYSTRTWAQLANLIIAIKKTSSTYYSTYILCVRSGSSSCRDQIKRRHTATTGVAPSDLTPPATRAGTGCRSRAAACTARARATTLTCPSADHAEQKRKERRVPFIHSSGGQQRRTVVDLYPGPLRCGPGGPTRVVAEVVFPMRRSGVEIITETNPSQSERLGCVVLSCYTSF